MPTLHIDNPQGQTQTHALGDAPVVLGRDPSCDIPLEDLGASRRHAEIRPEGSGYVIEDLGSKNGTLVNENVTGRATLKHGDAVLIGSTRIVFRGDGDGDVLTHVDLNASVVIDDEAPRKDTATYLHASDAIALSERRLEILYELTERLTRLRNRDELLEDAMAVCFEMLRFERGAIAVRKPGSHHVDWPVVRNLRGTEGELRVSRTILSSALTHGERIIVNDTESGSIDPTISMVRNNIRSAMCVPLLSGDQNLGVIYGDRVTTGTTYTQEDVDFLAGISRLVTTGLINAHLLDEQKLKVQLEGEMAMARKIQKGLFPRVLPQRSDVRTAALNDPGYHVSGDYYDFIELSDGRLAFLIADVTGEGVSASLLMANLQAAVRMSLPSGRPVGELLTEWSRLIVENTDASKFITCLLGMVQPTTRTLELGIAGHLPPFLVRPSGPSGPGDLGELGHFGGCCKTLEVSHDYPLGVIEGAVFRTQTTTLGPGPCTLIGYTDGVTEAFNDAAEQYSSARAVEFLASQSELGAQEMVKALRGDVQRHSEKTPQSDDITIIAVQLL